MNISASHYTFCFESYGVGVRLSSNSAEILETAVDAARSALLGTLSEVSCDKCEQDMFLDLEDDGTLRVIQNGAEMLSDKPGPKYWAYFDSLIRLLVADFAPELVFIHSGVVGWKGKAIVLPGNSFYGKTTLVAELVKCGARYYSDEYAIIDQHGLVHPFARPLSMRTSVAPIREDPVQIESLGGMRGTTPIPISHVLFTKFDAEAVANYEFITPGRGLMEMLNFTIGPRRNAEYRIKVLKNAFTGAIIVESPRADAAKFARNFLEFVDNTAI